MSLQDEKLNLQKKLASDNEVRSDYLNLSDEEDAEEKIYKVFLNPTRNFKKNPTANDIMIELMNRQDAFMKLQMTIQREKYKLQNELDREETKSRYLTLDLNNAQLENEELKKQTRKLSKCGLIVGVEVLFVIFYCMYWLYAIITLFSWKGSIFDRSL